MARTLLKTGLAALIAAAVTITGPFAAATAAQAGEWGESSRRIHRDEIGRFYVSHGERIYIQYWDHPRVDQPSHPIGIGGRPPHVGDEWNDEEDVRPWRERKWRHRHDARNNTDAAIIAGIAGLAVGAIIAGSQARPQQPVVVHPQRPLYPARPIDEPRVITYNGAFEPWSDEWNDWCRSRYRSFQPATGTYTGYDGVKRFCVVK
jgi:hypothetical protein